LSPLSAAAGWKPAASIKCARIIRLNARERMADGEDSGRVQPPAAMAHEPSGPTRGRTVVNS